MGQMELHTAGEDRNLVLTAEPEMKDQFIYIDAVLCDQDGNTATDSDMKITLDVEGCAEAVGFGSGNPKPKYNFNEGVTETFHGRAQIVLMRTGSGKVQVKVSAEDGKTAELNLI